MALHEINERVAQNLRVVTGAVNKAASGRKVTVVCVTKYARGEWVDALLLAGAKHLGENLLPKGAVKFDALQADGQEFARHLIGPPQSRKVNLIPRSFDWVQAIDRLKIAGLLDSNVRDQGETINGLLQVNIAEEESKHGLPPDQVIEVFSEIRERFSSIKLRGLMAIPPGPTAYKNPQQFESGTRKYFAEMKELFDKLQRIYPDSPKVDTLSLGMSHDYVWAIEEGATMVRVGSALYEGLED